MLVPDLLGLTLRPLGYGLQHEWNSLPPKLTGSTGPYFAETSDSLLGEIFLTLFYLRFLDRLLKKRRCELDDFPACRVPGTRAFLGDLEFQTSRGPGGNPG